MSYCPPSENGVKVNMIKQKFEGNLSQNDELERKEIEELKDYLRRTWIVSPVKQKKTVKPVVTRQLSNPGKNIKRSPAFRGEKSSRMRHLQGPVKEKLPSIVNRNVKIFEEKPEYGKIESVKKKEDEDSRDGTKEEKRGLKSPSWKLQETPNGENKVRTTVISRQKDISPIYRRDETISRSNELEEGASSWEEKSDRFFMNGAEYTKVRKNIDSILDVREELSRRIARDEGSEDFNSSDVVDAPFAGIEKLESPENPDKTKKLIAALEAPLPPGPPPKKPPRTFAHGSLLARREETRGWKERSESEGDIGRISLASRAAVSEGSIVRRVSSAVSSPREPRDSKKMLEKLEHVLIQHQKAIGPKVIMPRKENLKTNKQEDAREFLQSRLSRTLEDSCKSRSQARDSKRKHSTFDCLPSLNCATSSVYERIPQADFKSYFESENELSRSEDSVQSLAHVDSNFGDETPSPADKRSSTDLSSFLDGKAKRDVKMLEERVYAEPFAFDKNSGTDITSYGIFAPEDRNYFSRSLPDERFTRLGKESPTRPLETVKPELHYLCTSIEPLVYEDNNNVTEDRSVSSSFQLASSKIKALSHKLTDDGRTTEREKYDKAKMEQLLNEAFGHFTMAGLDIPSDSNGSSDADSLASSASINDELTSFNEKLRLFKNRENVPRQNKDELHRSLTEKRKNYVRRVSSKYSERREDTSFEEPRDKLFDVCLLVELDLSSREPHIKDKYPAYAKTPVSIENFCFPDANDWPSNSTSSQNQFYSLALMDERGTRRYGYCYRVRPEGGPILPLAYCLITKYRASGFYRKVLLELESRHGLPDKRRRHLIEELYNSPMPKPGQMIRMGNGDGNFESVSWTDSSRTSPINIEPSNNNFILSKLTDSSERKHKRNLSNNVAETSSEKTFCVPGDSDTMDGVIVRLPDPRLEERDMSQLFEAVSHKVLIILFASLLLERKVVLLCDKLGKLSSCIEALESLLYPFTWPHTFIPVLPDIPELDEILQAPLPFIIGMFKSKRNSIDFSSIPDGIVVDLDTSKIVHALGDESSILPSRLQKKIRSALQLVSNNTKPGEGIRNFLVSEAFLRAFVETCSHYDSHIVTQQDGKVIFQKESFVKTSSSKSEQYFLEWFVETTMFSTFIRDCIERVELTGSSEREDIKLFHRRVAEYRKVLEKNAQAKKDLSKKKSLGDRLKDLTNFHS